MSMIYISIEVTLNEGHMSLRHTAPVCHDCAANVNVPDFDGLMAASNRHQTNTTCVDDIVCIPFHISVFACLQ